jgi:hypothetical protein
VDKPLVASRFGEQSLRVSDESESSEELDECGGELGSGNDEALGGIGDVVVVDVV